MYVSSKADLLHIASKRNHETTYDFDARRSKSSVTHYEVHTTIQKAKDQEKSLLPLSDPTMA